VNQPTVTSTPSRQLTQLLLPLLLLSCDPRPPLPPPQLRSHTTDGSLPWLDGGFKDAEHFHGDAFGDYQLWVMRDELIPQYYK
jgi:hypothetical protein